MKLAAEAFVQKWHLRYQDNDTFTISEFDLREFTTDLADSFGQEPTSVPYYVAGGLYGKGALVRYVVPGVAESFYYSLKAGQLPAPTGASDANWKVVPGPVAAQALSQALTLAEAQGIAPADIVVGRLYQVNWGPDANSQAQYVFVKGLRGYFDIEGTALVGSVRTRVQVDVAGGTFAPLATGGATSSPTGTVQLFGGLLDSRGESAPRLVPQDGAQDFTVPAGIQIGQVTRFEKLPSGKYWPTQLARGNWSLAGTTLSVKEGANLRAGHLLDLEYLAGGASGGSTTPTTPPATGAPAAPGTVTVLALLGKLRVSAAAVAGATSYKVLRAAQAPGGTLGAFVELPTTLATPQLDDDSVQGDGTGYAYQLVAMNANGNSAPSPASIIVVPFARQFVGQGAGQATTLDSGTWQALAGATLCTQKLATPTVATGATMLVFLGGQQIGHFDYDDAFSNLPFLLIYQGQEYRGALTNGTITL